MAGEQTKERIFTQAVRLFSEQGYAETTIRQIARAVHVNEATIYIYFSGKADILGEILKLFEEKVECIFFAGTLVNDNSAIERPRETLCRLLWNRVIEDDEVMLQMFRIVCIEQFSNPKAKELVTERLNREVAGNIRSTLDRLIEAGEIPAYDTVQFAELWTQVLFSSAVMASHEGDRSEMKKNLRAINELLLDMAMTGNMYWKNRWNAG